MTEKLKDTCARCGHSTHVHYNARSARAINRPCHQDDGAGNECRCPGFVARDPKLEKSTLVTYEAKRLRGLQNELRAMADRLDEMSTQLAPREETLKRMPAELRKQLDLDALQRDAEQLATLIRKLAASLDVGIGLAEIQRTSRKDPTK